MNIASTSKRSPKGMLMNRLFIQDYERFTPHKYAVIPFLIRYVRNHELRYIYWARVKTTSRNPLIKWIASLTIRRMRRLYGIELNLKRTGGGIRLIHPWNITVNDNVVIGENVTLFKGCTVGVIESGDKQGNPCIGNNVTIYANATICGKIKIGDGAVIAAGSFVNFDVPAYATVLGNPGVIHVKRENV